MYIQMFAKMTEDPRMSLTETNNTSYWRNNKIHISCNSTYFYPYLQTSGALIIAIR